MDIKMIGSLNMKSARDLGALRASLQSDWYFSLLQSLPVQCL
jgi:hypothetical protein